MRICFFLNGHEICFVIPILYIPWPPHIPDPGPEKWIISELVKQEVVNELRGLATVHDVGRRVGGELGAKITSFATEQAKHLSLPKDMKIEFSEKTQR